MAAMTSSILDTLTRSLGSSAFAKAAATYGESDPAVTKGFTVAVAAALAPLVARAADALFMSNLLELIGDVPPDVTALDQPDRLFTRPARAVEEAGPVAMLRSLVFGGNTLTLTTAIANASGVKPSTAASLFAVALPTVLGYLSRLVARENLDSVGLGRRLGAERSPLVAVLPASLGSLLSAGEEPGRVGVRPASAPRETYYRPPTPATPARKSSSAWFAAAIGSVIALIALYALLGRTPRTPEGTPGAIGTAGYIVRVLPDGTNLRFPAESTESKLLAHLENKASLDGETWYDFDRIGFDTDASTLRAGSREQLANIAAILEAYPSVVVKIGGYTDNSGDAAANRRLSRSRAESVMRELGALGVATSRLEAEGYGAEHPIADNATADGRARNRRVALRATVR